MKKGELINGYRIVRDFTTAGGGLSKWSFAKKDGDEFFIKEFLAPTFPAPGSPGSEQVKARKKEECEAFEKHHRSLMGALAEQSVRGGNLIYTLDFFRFGSKYYKVTEKVDVAGLKPAKISRLPLKQRLLVMTTVAHSLRILHSKNIVHGDLKLDNVLIKLTRMGSYTSKLIDFDDSYFTGQPPLLREEVVGDMVFYSPELAGYIQGLEGFSAEDLTPRSDMFALGLLYALYLSGSLPEWNREQFPYAWHAVLHGEPLALNLGDAPVVLQKLIGNMLHPVSAQRPDVDQVFDTLKPFIAPPRPPKGKSKSLDPADESELKGKLHRGKGKPANIPDPDSKLRGSLIHPKKKKK